MQIDFKSFNNIIDSILDFRMPVMIRGRHGIGKSELVYQIAERRGMPVVERRASQMTEGDLIGLPSLADNRTRWNPPDWFKQACEEPVVLFLDEVDRATIEVRQGIFELGDSRKLNGHTLHPGTLILAAVNGGVSGQHYQVGEMDPAELDRWTVFDVNPTVEDWLSWGKIIDKKRSTPENQVENIHPMVREFIKQNRENLEHKADFEPNKKYPSRRSWKRCNDVLTAAGYLDSEDKKVITLMRLTSAGFIGQEAAIAFSDFVDKYERQLTPDDILVHGKFARLKDYSIVDHCNLIDKMVTMKTFVDKTLPEKQMKNLAKYASMLPSEAFMKLFETIGSQNLVMAPLFHKQQLEDGRYVSDLLASIVTGKLNEEGEVKAEEAKAAPAKKAKKAVKKKTK